MKTFTVLYSVWENIVKTPCMFKSMTKWAMNSLKNIFFLLSIFNSEIDSIVEKDVAKYRLPQILLSCTPVIGRPMAKLF